LIVYTSILSYLHYHYYDLDRSQYQLGSLSHIVDAKATGYQELPDFPETQPDPTVRNVEVFAP